MKQDQQPTAGEVLYPSSDNLPHADTILEEPLTVPLSLTPPTESEKAKEAEAEGEIGPSGSTVSEEAHTPESAVLSEKSGFLSTVWKTGALLLGVFAATMLAVCLIEGVSGVLETGLAKIALGEIYGGTGNVTVIPPLPDTPSPPSAENIPESFQWEGETADKSGSEPEQPSAGDTFPATDGLDADSEKIPIVSADLSSKELSLINETPYTVDFGEAKASARAIPPLEELYNSFGKDAPVVLILHTHTTESYAEKGAAFADPDFYRSEDAEKNMLAVGKTLADVLQAEGINVIFCEELFDAEDFNLSYYKAALRIRQYIEKYPSISYIFDLHRDSIPAGGGTGTIRPVTTIDGKECAQAMFVVGTDHGGSGHTGWRDNFNLAVRVASQMQADTTGGAGSLLRAINLRSASFNEQYTKGSLLIEIGSVASSVDEAQNTARVLGRYLASEITG